MMVRAERNVITLMRKYFAKLGCAPGKVSYGRHIRKKYDVKEMPTTAGYAKFV